MVKFLIRGAVALSFLSLICCAVPAFAQPEAGTEHMTLTLEQQHERDIELLNEQLFRAIREKDMATLDALIAGDAVFSGAGPLTMQSKSQFKKLIRTPDFGALGITIDESKVHLQHRTAVAINNVTIQEKANGATNTPHMSVMNMFAHQNTHWQLIASYSANDAPPASPNAK